MLYATILILIALITRFSVLLFSKSEFDKPPFQFKLEKETLSLDEFKEIEVFSFKVHGFFNTGKHALKLNSASLECRLYSLGKNESDAKEAPVICSIEQFQNDLSPFFYFKLDPVPVMDGIFGVGDDWVRLVAVPVEALSFSRSGSIQIKARLGISLLRTKDSFEESFTMVFENESKGYEEALEERGRAKEIAVSLAVFISGIDGRHTTEEGKIVKEFIIKQLAEIPSNILRSETKENLNKAAVEAHAISVQGDPSLAKKRCLRLAEEISRFEPNLKFMVMELLLDVVGADGIAESSETELLNSLARSMGMDMEEYKKIRDKALPIDMYSEKSVGTSNRQIEDMLGLTDDMSSSEKKSQLSKEYRKWNALKNSSDPIKSKQAKQMVRMIGEIKKRL